MRTTVYTDASNHDVTEEWSDCFGRVGENSDLLVVDQETCHIRGSYGHGEWIGYETWTEG